jgi:hypothetical protein
MQLLVGRHLELDEEDGQRSYNIERHWEVRRLTATIRGSLAATIAAERVEHASGRDHLLPGYKRSSQAVSSGPGALIPPA